MRGKSNVIKRNVEKLWGARYLPKNTVLFRNWTFAIKCVILSTALTLWHRNFILNVSTPEFKM
jgi:hypothetical protein